MTGAGKGGQEEGGRIAMWCAQEERLCDGFRRRAGTV
jgi:hypothetical protein